MAALSFEDKFITAILRGQIPMSLLEQSQFSISWLSHRKEMYEWVHNYFLKHEKLPDRELAETRHPDFQWLEVDTDGKELIEALNRNSVRGRLHSDIQGLAKLLQNGENPEKIIALLRAATTKYSFQDDDQDVFDFTSPNFTLGWDDFKSRVVAFQTHGMVGLPSGLGPEFDAYLNGGLYPGMLYGAIGASGIGKSWMSQVIGSAALREGKTAMYFAFEGVPAYEYYRFLTIMSGISNSQTMQGSLPPEAFETAKDRVIEIATKSGGKFLLATFGKRLKYTPELLHKKIVKWKPNVAILDYIQMMGATSQEESRWQMLLDVSRDLKIIAQAETIPIVANLQTDVSGSDANNIAMGNIGDSKGMIRDFDWMWGYSKVKGRSNMVRINSAKARFSIEGGFKALYQTNWDAGIVKFLEHISEDTGGDF